MVGDRAPAVEPDGADTFPVRVISIRPFFLLHSPVFFLTSASFAYSYKGSWRRYNEGLGVGGLRIEGAWWGRHFLWFPFFCTRRYCARCEETAGRGRAEWIGGFNVLSYMEV